MTLTRKDLTNLQKIVEPILLTAGLKIMSSWAKIQTITYKDKRDITTNVDIEVEDYLRNSLYKILPEAGFYVEEGVSKKKQNITGQSILLTVQNITPDFFLFSLHRSHFLKTMNQSSE